MPTTTGTTMKMEELPRARMPRTTETSAPELPSGSPAHGHSQETEGGPSEGDTAYADLVTEAAALAKTSNRQVLEFYYDLGEKAGLLEDGRAARYGKHTVDQFAKDLKAASNMKISPSSIYKAIRFEKTFNRESLHDLVAMGFSWRNASFLCAEQVPAQTRKELITRVKSGEIQQDKIKNILDEELGLNANRTRQNRAPNVVFKKISNLGKTFTDRMADVDAVTKKLESMRPVQREAIQSDVNAAYEMFLDLAKTAKAQADAIKGFVVKE